MDTNTIFNENGTHNASEQSHIRMVSKDAPVIRGRQLSRFNAACDKLHAKDVSYSIAVYGHFLLRMMCIILAILMFRFFIMEPTYVDGESMMNTLLDRQRVLVEKVSYWFNEPKRGDIVIVHYPNRKGCFVKRVMAVGGETITIRNGWVYIDGIQIDESAYADESWYGSITNIIRTEGSVNGSFTVPEGYVFVMGDNRNWSHDSRAADVGPIALEQVIGKGCAVIWPLNAVRGLD